MGSNDFKHSFEAIALAMAFFIYYLYSIKYIFALGGSMNYTDKLIDKFFIKCILNIKSGFAQSKEVDFFYERRTTQSYFYEKEVGEDLFFLIKGTCSGIGIYINKRCLFKEFELLCSSEFYNDIERFSSMKKNKKTIYSEELCDIMTSELLSVVNEKVNSKTIESKAFSCKAI